MDNSERNEHFQGFARLQYSELARLFLALYSARVLGDEKQAKESEKLIKTYLSQRAYDLVYHLLDKAPYHSGSFDTGYGTPSEIREIIEHLPDLTQWPTPPEP